MTSVLLGRVTPILTAATTGGNKNSNYYTPTPVEYMQAMRNLYNDHGSDMSNGISSRMAFTSEHDGHDYRFDVIMDDQIPTYANIMDRVTALAKDGFFEDYQGIAFPLTHSYITKYAIELNGVLTVGQKQIETKTKRTHDAYKKMCLYTGYIPSMRNLSIGAAVNLFGDRRQTGINRVNEKLTMICIDINEYPDHYGFVIDDSFHMDPHMLFIRSRDLNFNLKAVSI